ncbi:MAG: hypothetical protein ABI451_05065 [Dokdonella sp.]
MLEFLSGRLGFRVDLVMPADAPTVAVVSGHGVRLRLDSSGGALTNVAPVVLRLECDASALANGAGEPPSGIRIEWAGTNAAPDILECRNEFVLTRFTDENAWGIGRAGMLYRDLIPDRMGGRFIASHIRIVAGGAVPDYVHFHKIRFQMIYCKAGSVQVVYEDQGPPFVLESGDCVLQPPQIRHRVLHATAGAEVIEIGCPAVHETVADHDLSLPTTRIDPDRLFGGQRFVRHVAAKAIWSSWLGENFETRDTGIADATFGLADVRVVRLRAQAERSIEADSATLRSHDGELLFLFVLNGTLDLVGDAIGRHELHAGDACAIPANHDFFLHARPGLKFLEVSLRAERAGD